MRPLARVRPSLRSAFHRAIVWLLAALVPLHALAAAVIAVAGPSHSHREPPASTRLVLDDFRRAPPQPLVEARAVAMHRPHGHDHGETARHRHAAGDASDVFDPSALSQTAIDDLAVSPSQAVFVGLISMPTDAIVDTAATPAAAPPRWRMRTHHPALPDRPPRATA